MDADLARALRERVLAYLNGAIALDTLEDFVLSRTWDLPMPDPDAPLRLDEVLTGAIVAYDFDDIDEAELRRELYDAVRAGSLHVRLVDESVAMTATPSQAFRVTWPSFRWRTAAAPLAAARA